MRIMRDVTLSDLERLGADLASGEAEDLFQMDEDAFLVFYDRTARPVGAYLSRMPGDPRLADDLLQESYYRLLRARVTHESDAHRRNYLFRIATNLVRDLRRRPRLDGTPLDEAPAGDHADPRSADLAAAAARRLDPGRAMTPPKPRDRALRWLAHPHGP